MRGRRLTVRSLALMGAASAAIHQMRYAIGYGHGASAALAAHPHGYLSTALPGILTACVVALAALLARAAGARRHGPGRKHSLWIAWLSCTVALAAIYGVQETLEGAGAIAGSGWIGLALAVPAGLLVALAVGGAGAADGLRVRDALVRFAILAATPMRAAATRPRSRRVPLLLRARGPPVSFVF